MSASAEQWASFYARAAASGAQLLWPSETLVRLLRGAYIPDLDPVFAGKDVADIGCGNGNNLVFLAALGARLHATEIDPDLCAQTSARLAALGIAADIRVGTNRALPFEDASLDLLVSWNVIHYEPDDERMRAAIAEYARVLRSGGRLVLSTTGPEHKILKDSTKLGPHRYRIGRADDFRAGQVFFYFDTPAEIERYFSPHFAALSVGRTHDRLMTETLDWYVVSGVRP